MSPGFTDAQRLKRDAKRNLSDGTSRLRRWWSRKYNRPSNDPLFTKKSTSEHLLEMFEDLMIQREELRGELHVSGVGVSEVSSIMKSIAEIDKILGDVPEVEDPLVEEWEAALDRGEEPDI